VARMWCDGKTLVFSGMPLIGRFSWFSAPASGEE